MQTLCKLDDGTMNDQWQALLDAAVDGIIVADHEGIVGTFNGAAERLFGFKAEEVIGKNVSMLMPEPDHSLHDGYLEHYRRTGERKIIGIGREVLARKRDGTVFPIELSVGEAAQKDGSPSFVGIIRDISDRKRALEALRKERDLTQSYLDLAQVIVVKLDKMGRIVMMNRTGLAILGYKEEELIGQDWFKVCVLPKVEKRSRKVFDRLMAGSTDQVGFFENPVVTKNGEVKFIEWRNAVVRDGGDQISGTMSSGLDLTDRHRTEEEIRQARERLSQFGRLSTIGEMAAGLAHEINQPLTAIAAYTQACRRLIDAGRIDSKELIETASKINTQALRAGDVIRRLRKFVKRTDSGRDVCNCESLIQDVVSLAELDAKSHDMQIVLNNPKTEFLIDVDQTQIQQVVLNLIRNAIDSMEEGRAKDRRVEIEIEEDQDDMIRISVSDQGVGVSDDARQRLFDPFFTTKESGMGLGLPMCRSIIDAHGGKLSFQPNKDVGATFFFTLPRSRGDK